MSNLGQTSADVTPESPIPTEYLPVRLTNGTDFYNATGGGGGPSATVQVANAAAVLINPSKEDGNLASIKAKTDNLDVALSTRFKPFDEALVHQLDASNATNLSALNASLIVNLYSVSATTVFVSGTFSGTLSFEGSLDGATYFAVNATPIPSGAFVTSATTTGQWLLHTAGLLQVQIRMSAYTSGTATVYMRCSASGGSTVLGAPLPAGSNALGIVSVSNLPATQPVSGTFWQTTQPVSGPLTDTQLRATAVPVSGTVTATGPLTDTQLRASAVPISGTVTASGPLTDTQLRATAVPVSGTVTTTPPSNASTNVAQVAGTTADTNSGLKSAGTLRVVLATDQPALTNKLLVTPDSVALPANQSVNQTQWNGTTVDANSGLKSAGTLRVVLATDQPALTAKLLVTPDSVALPANQSVNLAQTNGATAVTSVTGVMDVMPRKRTGSTGLSPNYSASHITTNATTTPTAATAYVNTLVISCSGAGTAWTLKVQNKEATPKILVPNFTLTIPSTGLPVILPLAEPVLMTSGIDIITAGTTPGIVDVFVTYWQ